METYFVIYSDTSSNGVLGLRPQVMWDFRKNIIESAAFECQKQGISLKNLAGIPIVAGGGDKEWEYERELTEDEIFSFSVEKLGDDGRLYRVFKTDDQNSFLAAADYYGLTDEANKVINDYSGKGNIDYISKSPTYLKKGIDINIYVDEINAECYEDFHKLLWKKDRTEDENEELRFLAHMIATYTVSAYQTQKKYVFFGGKK